MSKYFFPDNLFILDAKNPQKGQKEKSVSKRNKGSANSRYAALALNVNSSKASSATVAIEAMPNVFDLSCSDHSSPFIYTPPVDGKQKGKIREIRDESQDVSQERNIALVLKIRITRASEIVLVDSTNEGINSVL